jgi:hypothetical protein
MAHVQRRKSDLQHYLSVTFGSLLSCYTHRKPQATHDTFAAEVIAPIVQHDDRQVEHPAAMLMLYVSESDRAKGPDRLIKSPYGAIVLSCAYCLRATAAAFQEGDMGLGWSYMADARYWCGVAVSSVGIDVARERTITSTRETSFAEAGTAKGKEGASRRNDAYEPIRQYVYNLVRTRRPDSGWKSRSHAVRVVSDAAYAFSGRDGRPQLKKSGMHDTLDTWLANMPDGSELFPPRKRKS